MKSQFSSKYPSILLWIFIPVIFLMGFWLNRISEASVNIEEEYMAFPVFGILTLMSIYLLLAGILYWMVRFEQLIKWMTNWHITITLASLLYATFLITAPSFRAEEEAVTYLRSGSEPSIIVLSLILFIFVGTQLIFGYNIGLGLLNRKKNNY